MFDSIPKLEGNILFYRIILSYFWSYEPVPVILSVPVIRLVPVIMLVPERL